MTTTKTYNGWTTYETWLMALWFDNDEGYYTEARQLVSEDEDASDYMVGDKLKEYAESIVEDELPSQSGFIADFVNAGLSEVNWTEIARNYREEQ